jgi:hypothetical protein
MNIRPKAQEALATFLALTMEDNAQPGWGLLADIAKLNIKLKAAAALCAAEDSRARGIVIAAGADIDKMESCEMGNYFLSIQAQFDKVLCDLGYESDNFELMNSEPVQ